MMHMETWGDILTALAAEPTATLEIGVEQPRAGRGPTRILSAGQLPATPPPSLADVAAMVPAETSARVRVRTQTGPTPWVAVHLARPALTTPATTAPPAAHAPTPPSPAPETELRLARLEDTLGQLAASLGQLSAGRTTVQSDPLEGALRIVQLLQAQQQQGRTVDPPDAGVYRRLGELEAMVAAQAKAPVTAPGESIWPALLSQILPVVAPQIEGLAGALTTLAEARQLDAAARAAGAGLSHLLGAPAAAPAPAPQLQAVK